MKAMHLIGITALTVCLTGCSMSSDMLPWNRSGGSNQAASTPASTAQAAETQTAKAAVDYPVDLFAAKDEEERARRTQSQELIPLAAESGMEAAESVEEVVESPGSLEAVTNTAELVALITDTHDNSAFGEPEDLSSYIGQLAISGAAYCIGSKSGFENDAVSRARLSRKVIRRNFVYDPGFEEDVHEYFDASGNLLFAIADVDLTGGRSTGKIRLYPSGSGQGVEFYYDDVDIATVEEFDRLDESRKAAIGKREKALTEDEKAANRRKNASVYSYKKTHVVEDLVNRWDPTKWERMAHVYAYSPDHPRANADGYVEIGTNSRFVSGLLNTTYYRKMHRYSSATEENYIMITDADGNQLFTFNTSKRTKGVDLYRKDRTIQEGYPKKVLQLFPDYIDIEASIAEEDRMIREENLEAKGVLLNDLTGEEEEEDSDA